MLGVAILMAMVAILLALCAGTWYHTRRVLRGPNPGCPNPA